MSFPETNDNGMWKKWISEKNMEKDPNGLNSKEPGSKLDAGKPPVMQGMLQYFPRAINAVAEVSAVGAKKYSWKGWESVQDGINRYGDALARHLLASTIEGPYDKDTGLLHDTQVAWNALARLELILREKESNKKTLGQGNGLILTDKEAKEMGILW